MQNDSTRGSKDVETLLRRSSDGIDMTRPARVVSHETVYRGAIFSVEDCQLALARNDGGEARIRRQLVRHGPAVVMLVQDRQTDRYLVEREYRVGPNRFVHGLPAGLIDGEESVQTAALRELSEETGVRPLSQDSIQLERVGDYYSSEGMSDEVAHILVVRLDGWRQVDRHFDADEHVQSAWVSFDELQGLGITGSNAVIALQYEELHRLRASLKCRDAGHSAP